MKGEYVVLLVLVVALVSAFIVDAGRKNDENAAEQIIIKPAHTDHEEEHDVAPAGVGEPGTTHHHQTFLVFLNGTQYSFAGEKYQEQSLYAHIHNWPFEIHTHATNVTLGFFFSTLNITFDNHCFVLDGGKEYCDTNDSTLQFFVDGRKSNAYGNHITADGEKYLISYGNEPEEELQRRIGMIPDAVSTMRSRPLPGAREF